MRSAFVALTALGVGVVAASRMPAVSAQTAPARQGGAATAPQTGTGLVLGQVVDASTGQPVPGATVTMSVRRSGQTQAPRAGGALTPPAPPPAALGVGGQAAGGQSMLVGPSGPGADRVIADAEGRFVFHDLPQASIAISVTASGYANGNIGQTRPGGPGRPLDLGDGERVADAKILLWKFGVLTGTVLDDVGDPAVGVTVRAFRKTTSAGRPQLAGQNQARTDDRGIFRISQLLPGDYVVAIPQTQATIPAAVMDGMLKGLGSGGGLGTAMLDIVSSGVTMPGPNSLRVGDYLTGSASGMTEAPPAGDGRLLAYQTMFYPSAASSAQATIVALHSGEERNGLNFQLRVVPTARVSGVIMGPDGPASNVGVRLTPTEDFAADASIDAATTATKADGSFTFLGVPPGQYMARVVKQPRPQIPAEMSGGMMGLFGPGLSAAPTGAAAMMLFGQAPITVTGVDVAGVSMTLTEGMKTSGRIVFDGTAAKPAPAQLQQFNVTLQSSDGKPSPISFSAPSPMTDQSGTFKTPGYPSGKYLITVSGPVPQGWMLKSAMAQGHNAIVEPIDLKDADVNDIVITFTDKTGKMSGTARGSGTGAPPPATVLLFPADFRTWITNGMPSRVTRSIATASGTAAYTLANLLAGDYLVAALDDRDVADNQDAAYIAAVARVATRVTVSDGEQKTLDLTIVRIR